MKNRVLFILKHRELPYRRDPVGAPNLWAKGLRSGLRNRARFVAHMLRDNGVEVKMVEVIDNNRIDREVHRYRPTHVIIEAFWVVPEKFDILQKLHPTVKWIIRNHREIPFLRNEGIRMAWTLDYLRHRNLYVRCNRERALADMRRFVRAAFPDWPWEKVEQRVPYLPNYYPINPGQFARRPMPEEMLRVGCFGAVRPLKNHLMQAVAAIEYARRYECGLEFHINADRVEGNGQPILKNLRELFRRQPRANLVEHGWLDHHDFLQVVDRMDLGMQVRFSETFNIVTADFVNQRVPVVVSPEIFWVRKKFHADPTRMGRIVDRMRVALRYAARFQSCFDPNVHGLMRYDEMRTEAWVGHFGY